MVNRALTALSVVVMLSTVAPTAETQVPAGEDVSITGTVIDISCKFGLGQSGEAHRMCAQVCGDRGIPLGILTDSGALYIPTTAAMPGESQNSRLRPFAEQRVQVTGKAFAAGGAYAIQVAEITKA